MRILILGLGSMGKRRTRNMQALGIEEIVGFDCREDRRKEAEERYGIETHSDFESAMARKPDGIVISLPPDLHYPYAHKAMDAGVPFFTEDNTTLTGFDELLARIQETGILAAPSCSMRYHPSVKLIKEALDSGRLGKPLCVNYHYGEYLPLWHPWEDYRDFYVSKRETGACRDIVPYDLDWLCHLVGLPVKAVGFRDKLGDLDCDIDDVYGFAVRFDSGALSTILVEVIQKVFDRTLRIVCQNGVITWDQVKKIVRVYDAGADAWTDHPEPDSRIRVRPGGSEKDAISEDMYVEEIEKFIGAIRGECAYPKDFDEEHLILKTMYAVEDASDSAKPITA